jgi:hypothetical protein
MVIAALFPSSSNPVIFIVNCDVVGGVCVRLSSSEHPKKIKSDNDPVKKSIFIISPFTA